MRISRHKRFLTALITLFSLLFAQLAVAAYACPQLEPVQPVLVAMADDNMAGPECEPRDKQSASLCDAHDKTGTQSMDSVGQPPVAPFVPQRLLIALVAVDHSFPPGTAVPTAFLESAGIAPPIAIRHCCFRN